MLLLQTVHHSPDEGATWVPIAVVWDGPAACVGGKLPLYRAQASVVARRYSSLAPLLLHETGVPNNMTFTLILFECGTRFAVREWSSRTNVATEQVSSRRMSKLASRQ